MGAGPRRRGRRPRPRQGLGPTAPRPRHEDDASRHGRARGGARRRGRALRPRPDARPLSPRPPRSGARPAAREALPGRFRPLRALDRAVRGVSRNRAPPASTPVLPPAARLRTLPLRRPRPVGLAPALALVGALRLVRPRDREGDAAPLHRPAAPRLRPLGEAPRALLPVRGVDARPLLCGRADLPDLPGRPAVGRRAGGDDRPDQQAAGAARRRGRVVAPLDDELFLGDATGPEEPVRGRPVAPWRLRVPRLPLRRDAPLADALAVADPDRGALSARAVVRGRLHGEPLHRRPLDRLRLRRGRALRRALVLAPARLARVARSSGTLGAMRTVLVVLTATLLVPLAHA